MTDQVTLLSEPRNFAVVQLPSRKFPGVVLQGDGLYALVKIFRRMRGEAHKMNDEDLAIEIADVCELYEGVKAHYERICQEKGVTLPYPK